MIQQNLFDPREFGYPPLRPIIKWAGGKAQLLNEIIPRFPTEINRYHEIFLGGGAVLFEARREGAIGTDINERLINLYKQVRDSPTDFVQACEILQGEYNQASSIQDDEGKSERSSLYYLLRSEFNNRSNDLRAAALFLFLNKTCFNGLYRENTRGDFNVPFGKRENLKLFDLENIYEVSNYLNTVSLFIRSFEDSILMAEPGDFIYADPPYVPLEGTPSFTSYHESGFGDKEQVLLRDCLKAAGKRGIKFMVSNSNSQIVRELYREFFIIEIDARRSVGANESSRSPVQELLIMNYGTP